MAKPRMLDSPLTRREVLGFMAAAGAVAVAGCGTDSAPAPNTPTATVGGASPTRTATRTAPPLTQTEAPTATHTSTPESTSTRAATETHTPASTATETAPGSTATPTSPESTSTATAAADSPTPTASPTTSSLSCVVRPQQTEGPYFVDEELDRSDIRTDTSDGSVSEGTRLGLTIRVARVNGSTCTPVSGAMVDVWHCDALGVYSDVADPGFSTVGQTFLRGFQLTDADGAASFITIYPGWYQGRTVHIHFKIRATISGQNYEFTSQLYFDDALTDVVHAEQPYASKGQRTLRNNGDGIYQNGGSQLLLAPVASGDGYAAVFDIGLQI